MSRLLTTLALLLTLAAPGSAQEAESRAAEIAGKQQEKAAHLGTRSPNRFEKRLLAMEDAGGLGVTKGWFVTFGDIKTGSGLALGPAYGKLFDNGTMVYAKGAYSIRNFKMAQLAVHAPPIARGRLDIDGRVRWQDAPTLAFYPIGTSAPKTRFDYGETKTEVSGRVRLRPVRFVRLGAGIGYEDFDTSFLTLTKPSPDLQLIFVPGNGLDPSYVHSQVTGALDWRDGPGYSRRGSLLQATWHDYRQQSGDGLSFSRTDYAAEQYIPVLHGNWVIFLGLRASTTSVDEGNVVPFFLMPTVGGNDLRGFSNYRFRDRNSLWMTAEYRWYVQEYADMAIFYDAGKVAARRSDLDFNDLESSVGAGIRFHGPKTTAVRLEVARSKEGWRLIFGFSPVGGR